MEAPNLSQSIRSRMESLRMTCIGEISVHQKRMESLASSLRESMESVKAKAQLAVQKQEKLSESRHGLKEAEDEFVKSLSVKTRKDARGMKLEDAIATAKSRLEEQNSHLLEQNALMERFAEIISKEVQDLSVREQTNKQGSDKKLEIHEAIAWYNKVLGLQIEGGIGVKFTFNNINKRGPNNGFSFTICHANDIYSLLKCELSIDGANEMIDELNQSSDLFRFVRVMRRKVQETEAANSTLETGSQSRKTKLDNIEDVHKNFKKVNYGKGGGIQFSTSSPSRQSSRNVSRK